MYVFRIHIEHILKDCDFITIDRKRELGNLKVDKLYRPAAPKYVPFLLNKCLKFDKNVILLIFRFRISNKHRILDNHGWVNNYSNQKLSKRYYTYKEKDYGDGNVEKFIEDDCLTQNKILLKIPKQIDEEFEKVELNSIKCENNLTLLTAEYNKQLSEHPTDINLWIKFVNHQVRCVLYNFIIEKYI